MRELDGSVNEKFITDMTNVGVNTFAVGSAIFDERSIKKRQNLELAYRTKEALSKWERR